MVSPEPEKDPDVEAADAAPEKPAAEDTAEETGGEAPKEPVIFSKFNDALAETGQDIVLPPWHRCYDYEAELVAVMDRAVAAKNGLPKAIIGKTVKGKGVSFMENQVGWHGVAPNDEQYKQAMAELDAQYVR